MADEIDRAVFNALEAEVIRVYGDGAEVQVRVRPQGKKVAFPVMIGFAELGPSPPGYVRDVPPSVGYQAPLVFQQGEVTIERRERPRNRVPATDLDAFRGMLERAGEKPRVQTYDSDEEGSFIVLDVRGTDGMCWKFDRDGKFVGYKVWGD